ncbi:branched-chain amino acid transport system II carrier protein [Luteococcus sp. H138]|uniref:branched-chain amino acid transport system II carrier protein n=1 Tax=unclassified Luteococcus TaxID=2639923 RepID=UPI00313B99C5
MSTTASDAHLSTRQSLLLGSLLFGLFFGAGNLIFPISMGLAAGSAVLAATAGFLVAAVGLPILGVVASAMAGTASLHELASRVAPWFGVLFTCALYLTIGPFFAIPRTATVSYEMAFGGTMSDGVGRWALAGFTAVFFAVALAAAIRPGKLLDYVGKWLTPVFLVLLGLLLVVALLGSGSPAPAATGPYASHAASQGVLDGYNTMDALASLAFAIVVIEAVRRMGVTQPRRIAVEVGRAGVVAGVAMCVIYAALAFLGARSTHVVARDANGAVALSRVASESFGGVGHLLAALIMGVACLKTCIGLLTACAEMFATMFPRSLSHRGWAVVFALVSFAVANVGLDTIIKAAVPVLVLLYPLAISMIVLGLLDPWVRHRPWAYRLMMLGAGVVSLLFLLATQSGVPAGLASAAGAAGGVLPGFTLGFGWILPALVGLGAGMALPRQRV